MKSYIKEKTVINFSFRKASFNNKVPKDSDLFKDKLNAFLDSS